MTVRKLTRGDMEALTIRVIRPASVARPDVRLIELDGRRFVVKAYDQAQGCSPFKRALGAYLVNRERVAFRRAAGIEGIPALCEGPRACTLVTAYVDGVEATSAPPESLTPEFFDRLRRLVDELHGRGVVHGDLKKLENVLISPDGRPFLVDFATAFVTGSNPITAFIFPWIQDDDQRAICKLKERCAPHLLTEDEKRFLDERSGAEKFFRWFRRYIRYVVKLWSAPEHERASVRLK